MNAPCFDLHWCVAAKRAVAEGDVGDVSVAASAVGDGADAGAVPIREDDVLNEHTLFNIGSEGSAV